MRRLFAIFAALCVLGAPAGGKGSKPSIVLLHADSEDGEALLIPAATPLQFVGIGKEDRKATFSGRFTLTGTYEVSGHGEDAYVRLWPDKKSRDALPSWRERGGPEEIYLENGWDFAVAVARKPDLARLETDDKHQLRGRISIIADKYETYIECDAAHFTARFVSVVRPNVTIAAVAREDVGC